MSVVSFAGGPRTVPVLAGEMRLDSVGRARFVDLKNGRGVRNPLVSVIVPMYNSEAYVDELVASVLSQDVDLELICVDDGSSDETLTRVLRWAVRDPRVMVITEDNSGSPSKPRNVGLDAARGKYVYFLDSDDILLEGALAALCEEGERTGNAVVLGKIVSRGGRRVPSHIFRKTSHRADLLEDYAWHNLSPSAKIIRRREVERLGIRFPEDQWIGEDQVFFAEYYLGTSGISILADQDCLAIRYRDDGENLTARRQSLEDKAKTVCRVAEVIFRYTVPGVVRDQLIQRLYTSTLPSVFRGTWQSSTLLECERFVKSISSMMNGSFAEVHRRHVDKYTEICYDLLLNGMVDDLNEFVGLLSGKVVTATAVDGVLQASFPRLSDAAESVIRRRFGEDGLLRGELTSLEVLGAGVGMAGAVRSTVVSSLPISVSLILRERSNGTEFEVPIEWDASVQGGSLVVRFEGTLDSFPEGVRGAFGTFVSVSWGESNSEVRWGKRPGRLKNALYPFELSGGARGIAYFNAGYENLTFDMGPVVHAWEPVRGAQTAN